MISSITSMMRPKLFGMQRNIASASRLLLEKQIIKVPGMGDSITEGTVIEWTAQVGQAVKVDDVVAMVETDKVTIEIKAEAAGVITQHFGKVDENIGVGEPLYEIDNEAEATVVEATTTVDLTTATATTTDNAVTESPQPLEQTVASSSSSSTNKKRVPMIRFLGKEGWAKKLMGAPPIEPIPPNYGRPSFSEIEMEALILGGASLAPEVIAYSYGAKFK